VADEAYLTQSIMDPRARVHEGFPAVMPSYLGQMAPAEVAAVVEKIRSLEEPDPQQVFRVPIADGGLRARVIVPEEAPDGGSDLRERVGGKELSP
jgi:cytochrome c oxidase subunit 2